RPRGLTRALVAALAAALAAPAAAENFVLPSFKEGDLGLGFHLGLALPLGTSGFSERAGRAPSFSFRLTHWSNSWVAWGGELGAEAFLARKTASVPGGMTADASYSASAFFTGLFGRVNLLESSSWSPYILAGGGLSRLSVKGTAPTPVCWPVSGACAAVVNGSSTGPYFTGGGGLEFFFLRGMSLALEGRFRQYRSDHKVLAGDAESLSVTLGTTFVF
ncbi:hypothetical protein EPO15_14265, partial [bacterium]